MLTNSRDH